MSPLPPQTFILADFCFYYVKSYAEGGCRFVIECTVLSSVTEEEACAHTAV